MIGVNAKFMSSLLRRNSKVFCVGESAEKSDCRRKDAAFVPALTSFIGYT